MIHRARATEFVLILRRYRFYKVKLITAVIFPTSVVATQVLKEPRVLLALRDPLECKEILDSMDIPVEKEQLVRATCFTVFAWRDLMYRRRDADL